ncbi:hypothetical protein TrVFT333_006619 [Trichoderma virens FT-333]|nr:hypothetical protein TrVFT333_006619 [Trichoderma virens FT-333]
MSSVAAAERPSAQQFRDRHGHQKQKPFHDGQAMIGPPDCSWASFKRPLLRACPLSPQEIIWHDKLGYGVDGTVWKVEIDERFYALKVFWDNKPPDGMRYWAVQRECHNAALLQMIRTAVEKATEPIYLKREPRTWRDAARNLHAFSTEGSREPRFRHAPDSITVSSSSLPRFRECFGWMSISGADLCSLDPKLRPHGVVLDRIKRAIWPWENYFAILYEFISPDEQPSVQATDLMQSQIDFLWRAGFCMIERRLVNWRRHVGGHGGYCVALALGVGAYAL